jgi:hypothetical protein
MKVTTLQLILEDWHIRVQYIRGAPGFGKIPHDYQAVIGRMIYTSEMAGKYGLAFPAEFDGKREAHLQLIGLGYADSIRDAIEALAVSIHQSGTPDKDLALEAIGDAMLTLRE